MLGRFTESSDMTKLTSLHLNCHVLRQDTTEKNKKNKNKNLELSILRFFFFCTEPEICAAHTKQTLQIYSEGFYIMVYLVHLNELNSIKK